MLHEAGIIRAECFVTNVVRFRPPNNDISFYIPERKADITSDCVQFHDKLVKPVVWQGFEELRKEIEIVQPNVIVAFGNVPMWALTGHWGITSWRGSRLETFFKRPGSDRGYKVIPTYHPAAILRQWDWRYVAVHDLRVINKESEKTAYDYPVERFRVRPTYSEVLDQLTALDQMATQGPLDLAADLETRAGHIACIGLGWSVSDAICIPFMCVENKQGYWLEDQEAEIIFRLYQLLTHPNVRVTGQNFLYDAQYIWKWWHFMPNVYWDTMTAHHTMFAVLPRGLGFLSSLYCDFHVYWKEEGKNWDPSVGEEQLWLYNCKDAVHTWEITKVEQVCIDSLEMNEIHDFQRILWWACLEAMIRGILIDENNRAEVGRELNAKMNEISEFLKYVLGHDLNPRSTKQMHTLFYGDLNVPVIKHKKTKRPTLDDQALEKIATKEPLLRPLISAIGDYRTLGVFSSTFIEAEIDPDGRMRGTLDPNGTDTYRLSSYENAFGLGMNMQNIPSDKSKSIGKAERRVRAAGMELQLPNLRKIFKPDPGYMIFDADLDRADLQVVVWEAGDELLKVALRTGTDIHLLNAISLAGAEPPPLEELVETHERYPHWRSKYKLLREFAKVFVHATNYGASARTVAGHLGITVYEAEKAQRLWFGAHPGIKSWHERTLNQIMTTRSVENKFGYKYTMFDRVESLLPEALAWVPQSTVGCVINRGWVNLLRSEPSVQVLIQVHDSLVGQFPVQANPSPTIERIKESLRIVVPYEDPLIIPVGAKVSTESWGDCK